MGIRGKIFNMKRALILMVLITFFTSPCTAKNEELSYDKDLIILPNVFITDTSEAEEYIEPENITLKGYAEYMEDAEAIHLTDEDGQFVLNLKVPQKITSKKLADEHKKIQNQRPVTYSRFGAEEYKVIPQSKDAIVQAGGLSFGTTFGQEVDYSELEQTAAFFTRYDLGRFSLSSAYERTIGSTYNNYIDSVYVAPEIRLNKFLSVKEVLTSNITYRRKKAELVLSVNPLAHTKDDRLNLEFGAGQTYDDNNNLIRNRIRFGTKFKL